VESTWLVRKKNLDVIVPVLVSQLVYLLKDAENFAQESRNLIRILKLLEKCLPHIQNSHYEKCEILNALLEAAMSPGKIPLSYATLETFYTNISGDDEAFSHAAISEEIHYQQPMDVKQNDPKLPSLLGEKGRG
jgi:hypothetical protein